jgi:hypothetical protein
MLSLIESLESRLDHLTATITEQEAKQTVMLLNETMPIKQELTELRSAQGAVAMHVRWLVNMRLQNQARPTGMSPIPEPGVSPNANAPSPAGQSGRRLSGTFKSF